MSDKVQIGPLISKEARGMLAEMCKDDQRALGNWLDWMIRWEYEHRQCSSNISHVHAPHGVVRAITPEETRRLEAARVLVDPHAGYSAVGESEHEIVAEIAARQGKTKLTQDMHK